MIDLCVVSFNTQPLLKRLVDTLHSDIDDYSWSLYLQDNASTDRTLDYLNTCCMDHPTWDGHVYEHMAAWAGDENVGYSAACNRLASMGHEKILGFLNADVWLKTEDVKAIQRAFDDDNSIDILGPKQRNEDGVITHAGIFGTNTAPKMRGWKSVDCEDKMYRDTTPAIGVSGSAYFIRRDVWDELAACETYKEFLNQKFGLKESPGAFLPTPHFYEETWCSYHARAHGYNVVYDGRTSIGHTWHASSQVGSQDAHFRESRAIFRAACMFHHIECD